MDPLSAFLHTPAWENHLKTEGIVENFHGNFYRKQPLPGGNFYWISTRCAIDTTWSLPPFAAGATFLRLQPDSTESYENIIHVDNFRTGTGPAVQPRQTLTLDLTQPTAAILAQMKQKHRYNIKVAEKAGLTIEVVNHDLEAQFPRFWNLLTAAADRHTFHTHQEAHYRSILRHLEPAGMVRLAFARHNDTDVATLFLITCNHVATYLHGGSDYAARALMAPYLLHWQVMQQLKEEGFTTYDLWGTNAVQNNAGNWVARPNHPSAGTTRFKLGFGGNIITYPETVDIILKPFWYSTYKVASSLRHRNRAFS